MGRKKEKHTHENKYASESRAPKIPGDIGVRHNQDSSGNDFGYGGVFRPRYKSGEVSSDRDGNKIEASHRAHRRAMIPNLRSPPENQDVIRGVRFVKEGYDGGISVGVAEQIADQIKADVLESRGLEGYFDVQVKCTCSEEPRNPFVRIERGVVSWPQLGDGKYGPCDYSPNIRSYVSKAIRKTINLRNRV